jgi:hypothetical protein
MSKSRKPRGPRTTLSACAHEGGGKTTFSLTAPAPRAIFHIDPNTEEILEKEGLTDDPDTKIYPIRYPAVAFGDKDEIKDKAADIWQDDFIDPLVELLNNPGDLRSLIIDTATDIRDLQLLKWFGKTAQIIKELYTGPNMEMKGLLGSFKHSHLNVILLHRLKDVYETRTVRTKNGPEEKSEKVEGQFQRDGFNKTGFYVNAEVFLFHDPKRHEKLAAQFGMEITRCTARPALIGSSYWGREKQDDGTRIAKASFPFLMTQVYPTTSLDDWR